MIDLERALEDLADHLDHPSGDRLAETVRSRISSPVPIVTRRPERSRSLLAVAAVVILIVLATLTIPPARHAVARWFGIGTIEVRRSPGPPLARATGRTVPGVPGAPSSGRARAQLAAARKRVEFTIATPRGASVGALSSVAVDRRVPGGLVALGYPRFTVVEMAASESGAASVAKFVLPGAKVVSVTVNGEPGFWITGAHKIAFLDRAGQVVTDSVRRSGPVLVWAHAGVTYRVEGFDSPAAAQRLAATIR